MSDFWYFIIAGIVLMSLVVFLINFLLGGFFGAFMKVKASRGRKVLVKVRNPVQDYFRPGIIDEGFLKYTDRNKNERVMQLAPRTIYRACGVFWIDTDDIKNSLFTRDSNEEVAGFDAVKFDSLLKRALYRPQTLADNQLRVILFLVIGALGASALCVWLVFNQGEQLVQILSILQGTGVGVVE